MKHCLVALLLAPLIAGCTISTPISRPDALTRAELRAQDIENVIVSVTEAEIKSDADAKDLFWFYARKIDAEIESNPGLVASAKSLEVFGNKAWTLTVWKDAASLEAFITSDTHRLAVQRTGEMVDRGRFATYMMAVEDLPPDWDTARQKLAEEGREMKKLLTRSDLLRQQP